jgi:hypothetical protein
MELSETNLSDDLLNILIDLENKNNIKIFKKNSNSSNNMIIRDTYKIINDCNKMKKKKVLDLSNLLRKISAGDIELSQIKYYQEIFNLDLFNLDNIINIISNNNNKYIEIYEN